MSKLSSFFGVALLLLVPAMLSATPVAVGQLSFINDGTQQYFELSNNSFDPAGVSTALSFENLILTLTFADNTQTPIAAGGAFLPGAYSYDIPGISDWKRDSTAVLITSAELTGKISPASFQWVTPDGTMTFSSDGLLHAYLDLSGNTGDVWGADPADITVNESSAPSPVPEPSTLALLAGPALAFVVRRVRK